MKTLEKNSRNNKNIRKRPDKAVSTKKLTFTLVTAFVFFTCLIIRIGWIQFVDGASLKELASRQQTLNKIISPARGAIYDTNGKYLAISAKVDTITINPSKIVVKGKERRNIGSSRKSSKRFIRNI